MGLPQGSLRQDTDPNEILDYGDDDMEADQASMASLTDGLPQALPSVQRHEHADVD